MTRLLPEQMLRTRAAQPLRAAFLACAWTLAAAIGLSSCAATRPRLAGPAPIVLRPGVHLLRGSLGDAAPHTGQPGATLVCRARDADDRPVALAWFSLPELRQAAFTDADGFARMPPLPAGEWLVCWRFAAATRDDSIRVRFEAGSADTLEVHATPVKRDAVR